MNQALDDFRWILDHIANRPTRIVVLVPLLLSAPLGYHDASGVGSDGVWFPTQHLAPRDSQLRQPVLWRYLWPKEIQDALITERNPKGALYPYLISSWPEAFFISMYSAKEPMTSGSGLL